MKTIQRFIMTAIISMLSLGLAQGFSGTFQNDNGGQLSLQQAQDGSLQGMFSGPSGQMQIQGYVDPNAGAVGVLQNQQGQLGFEAQLSPDGAALQMTVYPVQNGQPDYNNAQQLVFRRAAGMTPAGGVPTPNPLGGVPQPGQLGQPGQVPGGQLPNQPIPPLNNPNQPMPPLNGQSGQGGNWVGSYQSGPYTIVVQAGNGDTYSGILQMNGMQYPFQAYGDQEYFEGSVQMNGGNLEFYMEQYEGQLYFSTYAPVVKSR